MSLSRRHFGSALAAFGGATFLGGRAFATSVLALPLAELQRKSAKIALVTPTGARAQWESLGGQRRVVTRTTALVHEVLSEAGNEAESSLEEGQELVLETLGGRVGEIQQRVYGEARLEMGRPCLVFAAGLHAEARRIVGMAQGHYPLIETEGQTLLRRSPNLAHLVRPPHGKAAVDDLQNLGLPQARRLLGVSR